MADLILSPLPTQAIGLAAIATVTGVEAQTSTPTEASGGGVPSVSDASSLVNLSGVGQLLSAVSAFRTQLEVLQSGPIDTSPVGILTRAEDFVEAFDSLQDRLAILQTLPEPLADTTLPAPLTQLLSVLDATSSGSLVDLANIGISLPTALLSEAETGALSILDPTALTTAVAAAPTETLATLAQATLSFLDQATEFEATVADTTLNALPITTSTEPATTVASTTATVLEAGTNPTVLEVAEAPELVDNPPADALLSDIQMGDLELSLAAAGLEVEPPAPPVASAPTPPSATAQVPTPDIPVIPPPALPSGDAVPVANLAPVTASRLIDAARDVDQGAVAATLELQNRLADPRMRAINNNLFDPAYAALMAASHLGDFAWPTPWTDPKRLETDTPGPVSAATMMRAISDYREAANSGLLQGRPVRHV